MAMAGRTQTMVQLTDDLIARLDERAAREGASRSQLIREAVKVYLAADRSAAIDRAIVEGYTLIPQAGPDGIDEGADLPPMAAALTADLMRRLNEEERVAGFQPW